MLPTVSLHHLERISLFDPALPCGQLLEHLVLPETATLHIQLQVDAHCSQVPDVSPVIATRVHDIGTCFPEVQLKVVEVSGGCRGQNFVLTGWKNIRSAANQSQESSQGDVRVAFSLEDRLSIYDHLGEWVWDYPNVQAVFNNFPLQDTVVLDVDFVAGRFIDVPEGYRKMVNVRQLSVKGHIYRQSATHFTKLLRRSDDGEFLFPALRVMTVEGINFAEPWQTEQGPNATMERLLGALEERANVGLGPVKLVLRRCGSVTRENVDDLSKFVVVDWDEWVQHDHWAPRT